MAATSLKVARVPAKTKKSAALIFSHGLGDSAAGWSFLADYLADRLPHLEFIFPNAPVQPVTVNGGMSMPSWYDIYALGGDLAERQEDEPGLLKSANAIQALVSAEIDSGLPSERIVVGGFSQGAAVSYLTVLTSERKLGGAITLSGYLPLKLKIASMRTDVSKSTPWFAGHGQADPVVPYRFGELSANYLKDKLGMSQLRFRGYPRLPHSASDEELEDVAQFLEQTLPPLTAKQ